MSREVNLDLSMQARSIGSGQQVQKRGDRLKSDIKVIDSKPATTKTMKQNEDGSFSKVVVTKDASGTYEQETVFQFDADGNKVIKSVRRKDNPLYGIPSETEYIDSDGDGFVDSEVQRMFGFDGKVTQETRKNYPNIKDENDDINKMNRKMKLIDQGIKCDTHWMG